MCNIRRLYCLGELYVAEFHKPGIYGIRGVWANAWDVFHRMPSRVARGGRAVVDFVVCFGWGGFFPVSFFSFFFFFFERTRPPASMRPPCLNYLSTSAGVRTMCQYLFCLPVCVCVCDIEFIVYTDCDGCTTPISTNPVSMQAGAYGRTRGTCFFVRRLEVVALSLIHI